jgi:uncharacterized protein (TIGR03083 family)
MGTIAEVDWAEARVALEEAVERLVALLRSVRDPEAPVLGSWNVAELAAHLSHAFDVVPALARHDRESLIAELSELARATTDLVADDDERDLDRLADRIAERAKEFLSWSSTAVPTDLGPWLVEGRGVTISMLTCHLLNEAVIHGYDIATAAGRPWKIDRHQATLIIEGFLLHVFRVVPPTALVDQERAASVKACYEIRLRGGSRFCLVFDRGEMRVEPASSRPVDCHLSVDPAAFLLVTWGRISQWRAIPKGQLLAWGRRPWLGLQMRSFVRNP